MCKRFVCHTRDSVSLDSVSITDTSLGPQPIFRLTQEESNILPKTKNTIVSTCKHLNSLQLN